MLLAVPAAWVMARSSFKGQRFIDALLDLPLVTPPLVIGIGLLLLLGHQGPLTGVFPQLSRALFLLGDYYCSNICCKCNHYA